MRKHFGALLIALAACGAAPAHAERDEPLPRFEDALCPGVAGLQTEAAELMVGRIRENAAKFDRKLAPASDCEPNVIVAFVPDGRAFLRAMKRGQDYVFTEMEPAEARAILDAPGPVHVVSRVVTRTRDGSPVYREQDLTSPPQAYMWMAHSKIYTSTQQNIIHALILIDRAAVKDITLYQLADYATMRALVRKPPEPAETGGDSILNLFAAPADARPRQLTSYDTALLGALYEGLPNLPANVRIAAIEAATGRSYPRE